LKSGVELEIIDTIGVSDMKTRRISPTLKNNDYHNSNVPSNENSFISHINLSDNNTHNNNNNNNQNTLSNITATSKTISNITLRKLKRTFLHVDAYRIDQVIRNLISNAIKFTPTDCKVIVLFELDDVKNSFDPLSVAEEAVGILRIKVDN